MKILIVDDDEVMRTLLREVLEKSGYAVQLAASGEAAIKLLRTSSFPVVVSDIRMLELDGMAVLREAKKSSAATAVILMTGFGSMEGAIEAVREGAFDYISKPFKMDDLKAVVQRAAKHWESLSIRSAGQVPRRLDVAAKGLIGKSPRIVDVYKTLARAALSTSTVLISGENGTGKELVAHAIHENGPRRGKKFITVDCATLDESFPDDSFREADGGTVFLDEVGDIAAALQVKLLRVLQEERFEARVMAATHRDLAALVHAGKFREDLYYRLNVISIELPSLRERMEDLPDLVGHFLAYYAEKNHKPVSHVSDEAMALLRGYSWPGNVRELEHAIERAVAMASSNVLFSEDFSNVSNGSCDVAANASLEELERAHIVRVLSEVHYNKSKASEVLGIDRATLYRKAQRYGIDLRGK
jgi:DNA-binding NtrC family response regulator